MASKGCSLCGAIYHTKAFCYKNRKVSIVVTKPKPCDWCGYPSHPSSLCWLNPKRTKGKPLENPLHCIHCDEFGHTRATCPVRIHRNQIDKKNIATGRYPDVKINTMGKYNRLWKQARKLWIAQNPPNHEGYYRCHYCLSMVPKELMTLDHKESRSRHPELRFILSNLVPCCSADNERKGSRSHNEYVHECHA